MNYIATFVRKNLFVDFCLPELLSLCQMFNTPIIYDNNFSYDLQKDPLIRIDIPNLETSDIAEKLCSRAVLLKSIVRVYSTGNTYDDLISNLNKDEFYHESSSTESFRFEVDARGKTISQDEKLNIINRFHVVDFKGKVDLKNAKRSFVVIDNEQRGIKYFGRILAGKDGKLI
jgi:hypothetical protein